MSAASLGLAGTVLFPSLPTALTVAIRTPQSSAPAMQTRVPLTLTSKAIIVLANALPQPQPPGSQAPTKPGSKQSPAPAENTMGGGCWLQGAGWAASCVSRARSDNKRNRESNGKSNVTQHSEQEITLPCSAKPALLPNSERTLATGQLLGCRSLDGCR